MAGVGAPTYNKSTTSDKYCQYPKTGKAGFHRLSELFYFGFVHFAMTFDMSTVSAAVFVGFVFPGNSFGMHSMTSF